jgi:flagellar biosynthetic protein FliQ
MSQTAFLDLMKEVIFLIGLLSAPILLVTLVVGLVISLIQAVTQIQEATLTFVPKILASLLTLVVTGPWMVSVFVDHTQRLLRSMATLGH